jgi:multidrug efflux pump subunit AcrA (membrane-fusion protein)
MNSKTNRALAIALTLNVVLAAALAFVWWRSHRPVNESAKQDPSQASAQGSMPAMDSSSDPKSNSSPDTASSEPVLAPIQLSPQRLQSIGVKLGTAQMKAVSNDIRVTGNVEVDERQLSTVQLRFPGWIRKVFVDATYDYVRKGQPLFTIYSPDLVTTQQEYLLARRS